MAASFTHGDTTALDGGSLVRLALVALRRSSDLSSSPGQLPGVLSASVDLVPPTGTVTEPALHGHRLRATVRLFVAVIGTPRHCSQKVVSNTCSLSSGVGVALGAHTRRRKEGPFSVRIRGLIGRVTGRLQR